jgi:hypothetical protein
MSTVKGLRAGVVASILAGAALAAGVAGAQGASTERPGSILIFPKVVNDGADTIIQITNVDNSMTYAHCFYVNGDTVNGQPLWQVTDFELALTRQQPTHWAASQGRAVNPTDNFPPGQDGSGIDPGVVPPVVPGFTGFLTCVETLADGTPVSGNKLIGTATIGTVSETSGNVSKYNAVAIPGCVGPQGPCGSGGTANSGDNVLELNGAEYARCPGGLWLNFQSEGSSDPAIDGAANTPSVVSTNLSLVPCGLDLNNLVPTTTDIYVGVRDEFESFNSFSSGIDVDCYLEAPLSDPQFRLNPAVPATNVFTLPTTFGTAYLRPRVPGDPPVLGVANVLRTAGDGTSDTAAMNLPFCTDVDPPASCVAVDAEIRLPSFP